MYLTRPLIPVYKVTIIPRGLELFKCYYATFQGRKIAIYAWYMKSVYFNMICVFIWWLLQKLRYFMNQHDLLIECDLPNDF